MRVGSLWCNLERKKTNLKTKGEPLQIFLRDDTTKTWKKDPITRQKILVKNSIGMMIRWRKRNYENDYPTIKRRISQHWANQSRTLYDLSFFFSLFFVKENDATKRRNNPWARKNKAGKRRAKRIKMEHSKIWRTRITMEKWECTNRVITPHASGNGNMKCKLFERQIRSDYFPWRALTSGLMYIQLYRSRLKSTLPYTTQKSLYLPMIPSWPDFFPNRK